MRPPVQMAPRAQRDRSRKPEAKARAIQLRNARRAKPATLAFLALAFGLEA